MNDVAPRPWRSSLIVTVLAGLCATTPALAGGRAVAAVDRSAPPPLGRPAPVTLPVPERFTLKSGLPVYFVPRQRAPLVDVVVNIKTGALDDASDRPGEAVALAAMLSQGAGDRDAFAFSDAAARLGASLGAGVDWTSTNVTLHVASVRFVAALPLLADLVLRPVLTGQDWDRKRDELVADLAYARDEPAVLARLAAARTLFGTARMGQPLQGTSVSLTATTVDHLRQRYARDFRPDDAFVVVVGDIDRAALESALQGAFGAWAAPRDPPSSPRIVEPPSRARVDVVVVPRPAAVQSALVVAAPIPVDVPPLHAPSAVMQTLLGGSFTSRLNDNLREEHGYSYGARYGYEVWPTHHSLVSTTVSTAVTIPALEQIHSELARIREPASVDEIARARSYEALSFPAFLDGGASIAATLASWLERGLADDLIAGYTARVVAVDAAAVQRAAERLVDPTRQVVVVVGDVDPAALARFGRVTTLAVDELLPLPAP